MAKFKLNLIPNCKKRYHLYELGNISRITGQINWYCTCDECGELRERNLITRPAISRREITESQVILYEN